MYRGWHQVAFTREFSSDDIFPVTIGDLPLVLVRTPEGIRAFDATCPHRGAHLGYGGQLDGAAIICPFHGHRITLGSESKSQFLVRGYRTLEIGGLLFVLVSEHHENGFTDYMNGLAQSYHFVPGFVLTATVSPEYVIENAFDPDHFKAVHGVNNRAEIRLRPSEHGELAGENVFLVNRPNPWQAPTSEEGAVQLRFLARAFSPTLVATELGDGQYRHVVITAATPTPDGNCVIRVSAAVAFGPNGELPNVDVVRYLLRDSRKAFEQDMVIWEHLVQKAPQQYTPGDHPVVAYRKFCQRFLDREKV